MKSVAGEAGPSVEASADAIFSARLIALLDDILAGAAPNAGRFCGYCYHPPPAAHTPIDLCPHCGRAPGDWPAVPHIPDQVVRMHRDRRSREATVVRGVAWGGLSVGVALATVPLILASAQSWTIVAFFAIIGVFYLLSANLANTVGDAIGYRWGQSLLRRRWQDFLTGRDRG